MKVLHFILTASLLLAWITPATAIISIDRYEYKQEITTNCNSMTLERIANPDDILNKINNIPTKGLEYAQNNWFNCNITNKLPSIAKLFLTVKSPLISEIDFYIYRDETIKKTYRQGVSLSELSYQVRMAGYAIPLQIEPEESIRLLIRIYKPFFKNFKISIQDQRNFYTSMEKNKAIDGILWGSLLVTNLLIGFLAYLWNRWSYLLLLAANLMITMILGKIYGIIFLSYWTNFPNISHFTISVLLWLSLVLLQIFVYKIAKESMGKYGKVALYRLSLAIILLLPTTFLNIPQTTNFILLILSLITGCLFVIIAVMHILKSKNNLPGALLIFAATSVAIVTVVAMESSFYPVDITYISKLMTILLVNNFIFSTIFIMCYNPVNKTSLTTIGTEHTPQQIPESTSIDPNQLYQKERISSLGTLTNGLAQELNNPLAIIAGHQYRLNAMVSSNNINISDFKTSLSKIDSGVKRVLSIIDALKAYSHDDTGKPQFAEVNIRETVQFALDLCRERLNSLGIKLITQPITDIYVHCNQGQIMQVLLILINNSIEALNKSQNKVITIEYRQTVTQIEISVIDSGPGIPFSVHNKIFDPFFTTDNTESKGLGLSIAGGIMTHHNGKLYLDEEYPQTKFVIQLPR